METAASTTIDPADVARFSALAAQWWDEKGPFAPLHRINPVRLAFIRQQVCAHFGRSDAALDALAGLSLLDIGCGGGLVAEPVSRMGAAALGIDASEKNIGTARAHAAQSGAPVTYRHATAEQLAGEGAQYDVVLALEIIEHVSDPELFLQSVARLVKPGGLLVMSTLNRTPKSWLLGIVAAERILRWLPRGTHEWKQFKKPHELLLPLQSHGLRKVTLQGMVMNPLTWQWAMHPSDFDVNYYLVMEK